MPDGNPSLFQSGIGGSLIRHNIMLLTGAFYGFSEEQVSWLVREQCLHLPVRLSGLLMKAHTGHLRACTGHMRASLAT